MINFLCKDKKKEPHQMQLLLSKLVEKQKSIE